MRIKCTICRKPANEAIEVDLSNASGLYFCGDCLSELPGAITTALMQFISESKL